MTNAVPPHLAEFTARLIEAHRNRLRFAPAGDVPRTAAEAYAVQHEIMAEFGPAGAYKFAHNPGQDPICAPIRADRVWPSGATVPVVDQLGVELEVGFEVVAEIPAETTFQTIARFVRPRPVIELVDTRIDGPWAEDPVVKLADLQISGALVLGPPLEDWDGSDLGAVTAKLTCGETEVLNGTTTVPGGSALASVATCAALLRRLGGALEVGQIVITGTLNGLPYFPAGTTVSGEIAGLGAVNLDLVAAAS